MAYRILLVDDEIHAIEGVKADLDTLKLDIAHLFTAYSMTEAQQIFATETVDILLCDIEMPQGSGLDLLAWVKQSYPNTVTIFLTSHADFKYAADALKLGSLDYLLKPVVPSDLEQAIRKAQVELDKRSEIDKSFQSHQLWLKHHAYIVERFWLDLINHVTPSRADAIKEQAARHHIVITDEFVFQPILIAVKRWNKSLNRRDEMIMEYALRNCAEEIIMEGYPSSISIQMDKGSLLIILGLKREAGGNDKSLTELCQRYISSCNEYFFCDLCCYIGKATAAQETAEMVAMLKQMDRNNVAYSNRIFPFGFNQTIQHGAHVPALGSALSLLKTGNPDSVIKEVKLSLDTLVGKGNTNAQTLHRFNQDFMQVLYSFLNERGVQAHRLFSNEESDRLSEQANKSILGMTAWIQYAINKALSQAHAADETETVIETIKRYISFHLEEELTREQLAEQVFLNPDYLSRVFKKEMGQTILDYITHERMKLAKELLSQSNIAISSIASSVGYTSFSHFAKIFKKHEGIGPTEYRNKYLKM